MQKGKTVITREEDYFMREAELFFRQENISPPKFPHLEPSMSFDEVPRDFNRFRDLDTIEEASTPLSSNTNLMFSTHGELRHHRDPHQEPITEDITTILSGDVRCNPSRPGFTLSTGANFSPR